MSPVQSSVPAVEASDSSVLTGRATRSSTKAMSGMGPDSSLVPPPPKRKSRDPRVSRSTAAKNGDPPSTQSVPDGQLSLEEIPGSVASMHGQGNLSPEDGNAHSVGDSVFSSPVTTAPAASASDDLKPATIVCADNVPAVGVSDVLDEPISDHVTGSVVPLDATGTTDSSESCANGTIGSPQRANDETAKQVPRSVGSGVLPTILELRDAQPSLKGPWVIQCRVLARTPTREYDSLTSRGKLFNAYLIDANGDTIRATVFNQGVDQFDRVLFPGAVCSLSAGRFKYANDVFSVDKCEVTFDGQSSMAPLDMPSLQTVAFAGAITSLADIPLAPIHSKVTVMGVVHKTTGVQKLKSKDGKPCVKSKILLVDSSMTRVVCTLWGCHAKDQAPDSEGLPLLIRAAQVSEYNDSYSLNVGVGTSILFDPSGPEADGLRTWYANLSPDATFSSI